MGEEQLRLFIEKGYRAGKKMYLMMPLIFRKAVYEQEKAKVTDKMTRQNSIYHMKELTGFVIRNMESYCFLTQDAQISPDRITADANLYVANREGREFWKEQGVYRYTLPLELTQQEIECLVDSERTEAVVYGYIPLMVSAQCLCYNTKGGKTAAIRDGKGRRFYLYAGCKYCYNMIYHGEPMVLEKGKEILWEKGVRRFRYDFTLETHRQVRQILSGVFPRGQQGHFYQGME
jgi:putative protease